MPVLKSLKWHIAHVWDMLWFTDQTCKIYWPEKMAGKISKMSKQNVWFAEQTQKICRPEEKLKSI